MNEPGVAELGGATPGVGIADDTNMQVHQKYRNEQLCTENRNETSNLHTETAESRTSTAAAESLIQHANQMTNKPISNQHMEAYMKGLDAGKPNAMYELACCCMNDSISDDLVHRITENTRFKKELCELARKYALGFAEPDSDCEAVQLFEQVADQNDLDVLCALGRAYNYGWGVEKNVPRAIEYYVRAADAGSYEAMERLRGCQDQNVDEQLKAAFEHFKQQVDVGNDNAQVAVAQCYYLGIGVAENDQTAIEMCEAAFNQQNGNAMVLLGQMYKYGHGVEENEAQAVKLYKQAANAGNTKGQYRLGECCYNAIGVDKDCKQAVLWFKKAAAQGHVDAASELGNCYENGKGVDKDLTKAFWYYKQAAIAGNDWGQYNVGICYKDGEGIEQNYKQAVYWFQKVADQGNTYAEEDFSECFEQLRKRQNVGIYISQIKTIQLVNSNLQHTVGFYLARFAAQQGCNRAYSCLGDCYFNGIGTAIDFTAAAMCYQRAEQTDSQKYLNLVRCLETGQVDGRNEIDLMSALNQANAVLRMEINEILLQML